MDSGSGLHNPCKPWLIFPPARESWASRNASIPFSSSPSQAKASGNSRNDEWCYCLGFNWWEKLILFLFFFFFGFQLQAPPARERKNNKKPTTKHHQPHDLTFFKTALVKSKAVKPVLWYRTYLLIQPLGLNGHFAILNWTRRLALKKNIISEKVSVIWFWILK